MWPVWPCSWLRMISAYVSGQTVYADGGRAGLNYSLPVPEAL